MLKQCLEERNFEKMTFRILKDFRELKNRKIKLKKEIYTKPIRIAIEDIYIYIYIYI